MKLQNMNKMNPGMSAQYQSWLCRAWLIGIEMKRIIPGTMLSI